MLLFLDTNDADLAVHVDYPSLLEGYSETAALCRIGRPAVG